MNYEIFRKKTVFFMIFLLLVSLAIIIAIMFLSRSGTKNTNNNIDIEGGEDVTANYGKIKNGGVDSQAYNDINACMKKYLNAINMKSAQYGGYDENNNYIITSQESEIKQTIYNLLGNKYINKNNITVENVYEHIKILQESAVFVPIELSMVQDGEIKSFAIYGLIESVENYTVIDKIFAIVNIDFYENKFSIEPIYGNYNNISEIKIEQFEDTIASNQNNKYYSEYINSNDVPDEYINLYKRLMLGCPEKIFELLDEEYRNARFKNIENFKKYVKENEEKIKLINLEKCQVIAEDEQVIYVCADQNERYYIFKQKDAFQDYSIILDTHTVDLPEFIEKYNNASDQVKVGMNIEKVISAINNKDYTYIYNKLHSTFRNSKFSSEEALENYIKSNFFEVNNIEYIDFSQEGNVCIYKTKITEKNAISAKEKQFNIIMQLGKGTDFTMSFNME